MSSETKKQLQEVKQLIIHGGFQEALKVTEDGLTKKDITKEEELSFLAHKCEILFCLGNTQESLQLAELLLKRAVELDNILPRVDALIWKAASSFWEDRVFESLEAIEKGLTLISTEANLPTKAIAKRKAQLLHWQSFILIHLGDERKGLELAKEALSLAEESGYKNTISHSSIVLGEAYMRNDERNNGKEYLEKALVIANELRNKFYIAYSYALLTRTYNWIRDFDKVEDLYKKVFSLSKEFGSTLLLVYNVDMGIFYRATFHFDKALDCYFEALKAAPIMKFITYANIGLTYYLKYDLEQAQEYYLKNLKICEEINDRHILPGTLYFLVVLSLELNNLAQAKEYLNRLKEISEETGIERIDRLYRSASISIMKASGNISDLVKAAELLNEFLAEEDLPSGWRLNTMYSLLEIRLKELQLSATEEALVEVRKRLYHLEVEAKE